MLEANSLVSVVEWVLQITANIFIFVHHKR